MRPHPSGSAQPGRARQALRSGVLPHKPPSLWQGLRGGVGRDS
jgi:hypothetical protein